MAQHAAQPERTATRRQSTVYVDFADLEAKMTAQQSRAATAPKRSERKRRVLKRVDDATQPVRANVQDAAKAVAQWVALVTDQAHHQTLDAVLDRCLKPGADVQRVNFQALAREISDTLNVQLSAKRVRTAVLHLRNAQSQTHRSQTTAMPKPTLRESLDALQRRIDAEREALVHCKAHDERVSREIGTEILSVVRAAAGRVIESDFGESIPHEIDIDELEDRYLDFVREIQAGLPPRADASPPSASTADHTSLAKALHTFLVVLNDYDSDAASDVRLVVSGARVAAALLGPSSLPGLLAQLNVLVSGRDLIDTPDYHSQMRRLADAATALHDDPATQTYLNWARKLPEDRRVPSPIRVASYCHNNAATRLLEGLFTQELCQDITDWLALAQQSIQAMQARDLGFALLPVTIAIERTVAQQLECSRVAVDHFAAIPADKVLTTLEALYRFESNPQLAEATAQHAFAAHPALRGQLIHFNR